MQQEIIGLLSGDIIEDSQNVSLSTLCHCCSLPAEVIMQMIEHGIIEPLESGVSSHHWQFSAECVIRIKSAHRIQNDLGVNLEGTALALELLDEIKQLRIQVNYLQREHKIIS